MTAESVAVEPPPPVDRVSAPNTSVRFAGTTNSSPPLLTRRMATVADSSQVVLHLDFWRACERSENQSCCDGKRCGL